MEAEDAAIQLVTRCRSEEEFINRFARFATETDITVPALRGASAGSERHFVIRLKDGSVVMKGRCEVNEVQPVAVAPGGAPTSSGLALMRLRLREMDAHSCGIHLRLMERHASSSAGAEPRSDGQAAPVAPPVSASTTADVSEVTVVGEARPSSDTETTAVSPLPGSEVRAPGAALTLPANPLSDLDAADLASFVEHTLHESTAGLAGVRRSARRAAPYVSCLVAGVLLGIALRPGTKPAPVVVAPTPAAPPATAPPSSAPAPAPEDEPPIFADVTATTTTEPHARIKPKKQSRARSSSRLATKR